MSTTKKNIKVRDLKPDKDAKGCGVGREGVSHQGVSHQGVSHQGSTRNTHTHQHHGHRGNN
jgi:hypothetical protein